MHTTDHPTTISTPDRAESLRTGAGELTRLAEQIERSLVLTFDEPFTTAFGVHARTLLCDRLLAANQRQLHEAIERLRLTAFEMRLHADELGR